MPNKQLKHKNSRRSGNRGSAGRVETCHFHAMIQLTGVAGVYPNIQVTPSVFTRPADISLTFDEYRLSKLKFRIFPNGTPLAATVTAAVFTSGFSTTAPAFLTAYSNPTVTTVLPTDVGPSKWSRVPKSILSGLQPWYKSHGTVALADTLPGELFVVCNNVASTQVINVEFDGEFQFRGETDPADTPIPLPLLHKMQMQLQARLELAEFVERDKTLKEKNKLMLLLGYQESATVTSEGPIPAKWPTQTPSQLRAPVGFQKL